MDGKDAKALLTDSPWAKQIPAPSNGRSGVVVMEPGANGAPPPSASLGDPSNTTTGANMTVSANAGSASPVRLAVLKLRSAGKTPTDADVAHAMKTHDHYTIAAVGLPALAEGSDLGTLAAGAGLRVKGKPPITAMSLEYRRIGRQDVYFFQFPKSIAISTTDQEVEFKLQMSKLELKKKFDLRAMQYHGEIAL